MAGLNARSSNRSLTILLSLAIALLLMLKFAPYFPLKGDLVAHFLLVDEIMRHGGVQPAAVANLGIMAPYPPGSHWLAAIIGWIGGSGLVGMVIVSIVSVFVAYLLLVKIVGAESPRNLVASAVVFVLLIKTRSLIGWEIDGNFFYPQLVADVILLATLLWLSRHHGPIKQAALVIVAGTVAMFVQPLVAVHVLAAGGALIAYEGISALWKSRRFPTRSAVAAALVLIGSGLLFLYHPSFRAMRENAEHNGELVFGYSMPVLVALICAAVGLANLRRHFVGRAEYLDAVLGSAGVMAVVVMLAQFAALHVSGAGSEYAVKKHMFIIVTLAAINLSRMIAVRLSALPEQWAIGWMMPPVIAGLVSAFLLQGFDLPVAPVVEEVAYANHVAQFELPGFEPGNAASVDATQSPLINLLITMTAFQHKSVWLGSDLTKDAKYVLVRRTAQIDAACPTQVAASSDYAMVDPACLRVYAPGTRLDFSDEGNGLTFLRDGWSIPDSYGTWSDETSEIDLTLPKGTTGMHEMTFHGAAFIASGHPKQAVDVLVNGVNVAQWTFDEQRAEGVRSATIPAQTGDTLKIVFKPVDPVSPASLDPSSTDVRHLGLRIKSLTVQ